METLTEITRKKKPILFSTPMVQAILSGIKTQTRRIVKGHHLKLLEAGMTAEFVADEGNYPAYGSVEDILWVRETFYNHKHSDRYWKYEADFPDGFTNGSNHWKKKPSIFMPKSACRIFLQIINIRVEKLNDINESDAKDEGVISDCLNNYRSAFEKVWIKINGKESWENNPWVWVIEFKKIEKT